MADDTKTKVKMLMTEYDTIKEEVEACKSALETAQRKSSDMVRKIMETAKRKNFTYEGRAMTIRVRHVDKENPNLATARYFFTGPKEESMDLDDEA